MTVDVFIYLCAELRYTSTTNEYFLVLQLLLQEYTVKVGRAISYEPASKSYPALIVSLGSGVSMIKVRGRASMPF